MPINNYKLIENYFELKIEWEQALNLLYKNAKGSQPRLDVLWFKITNRRIFDDLPDLRVFLEKINKDFDSDFFEKCRYYDDWATGRCRCKSIWHMDGPIISLDNETVSAHKDINDAAYLQMIGQSFWKLDGGESIVLNPGDLLFISKKITHEVWGEGPRMGVLLMAPNGTGKPKWSESNSIKPGDIKPL